MKPWLAMSVLGIALLVGCKPQPITHIDTSPTVPVSPRLDDVDRPHDVDRSQDAAVDVDVGERGVDVNVGNGIGVKVGGGRGVDVDVESGN